ncbi:aldehyde dehydrogenase family protein [Halobacillus amylolyticus]|uniref:Aldehyde dehydrogenase family protein n=1 Tax=Halobacillus amylolyticus TaxID=2932259 RepID=A0ABY4HC20_9BACI|nr:aldehyde dehydrogenase family protein [Halobacillus amylolyticus]UOR12381.1 aldehyde dehydrogenase family protein [Halobacillus amylolyticus]
MIGAMAAGNTVILKPSEHTPTVSWAIKKMVDQYFPDHFFVVVEGEQKVTRELLDQPVDYIFFTGSVSVGKIIVEKASKRKRLIPVTFERGGKSPAIVHHDVKAKFVKKLQKYIQ